MYVKITPCLCKQKILTNFLFETKLLVECNTYMKDIQMILPC